MKGEIDVIRTEKRYVRKDGSIIWGLLNCTVVRDADGDPLHAIAQIQDVTATRRAMSDLAESEKKFKDFTELASDWTWETDERFRFTSFGEGQGKRISDVTGVDSSEMIGTARWDLVGVDLAAGDSWRRHREDHSARRQYRDFRWRFKSRGGGVIHLRASGRPIFDETGQFKGYRGVTHDDTPIHRRPAAGGRRGDPAQRRRRELTGRLCRVRPGRPACFIQPKFLGTYWDDPDIVRLGDNV